MFRAFSLAAAIAAFALAVLGSWIRINGAGMTCPDWPLCHGAIVPTLDGGVVLEWSHRMVALLEGLLVVGAIVTGWQARRAIAGVTPLLLALGGIFVAQVALGAGTVAVANSPWSVVAHWGMAMLFLGVLTALAITAALAPRPGAAPGHSALFPVLWAAAGGAFLAMCAGAFVSSSGAGLACSSLPGCESASWTGSSAAEAAQMVHRALAAIFFALATVVAYWAALGTTPRVRNAALCAYALIVLQVMLGMANVVWQLPLGLRAAHAAGAAATFIAFTGAIVFAAIDGTLRVPQTQPSQSQAQAQPVQAG
jgi:heme a synthase